MLQLNAPTNLKKNHLQQNLIKPWFANKPSLFINRTCDESFWWNKLLLQPHYSIPSTNDAVNSLLKLTKLHHSNFFPFSTHKKKMCRRVQHLSSTCLYICHDQTLKKQSTTFPLVILLLRRNYDVLLFIQVRRCGRKLARRFVLHVRSETEKLNTKLGFSFLPLHFLLSPELRLFSVHVSVSHC